MHTLSISTIKCVSVSYIFWYYAIKFFLVKLNPVFQIFRERATSVVVILFLPYKASSLIKAIFTSATAVQKIGEKCTPNQSDKTCNLFQLKSPLCQPLWQIDFFWYPVLRKRCKKTLKNSTYPSNNYTKYSKKGPLYYSRLFTVVHWEIFSTEFQMERGANVGGGQR